MQKLDLKSVSKQYGNTIALDQIDLNLTSGVYALLGHNGAGKSTLIKVLSTTLKCDSGEITYNGQLLSDMGESYRGILGYMPQNSSRLPQMSVQAFLSYIATLKDVSITDDEMKQFMIDTETYDFKDKLLQALSGGMLQRVFLAQALINNPKVLLLDEPTAGLDPVQRQKFRLLISKFAEDRIIILATHVVSDVELLAKEVIIMKEGKILVRSDQATLLSSTKVYETYEDISDLQKIDLSIKVTSIIRKEKGFCTRFISREKYDNIVSTTLDDVYLDWLG